MVYAILKGSEAGRTSTLTLKSASRRDTMPRRVGESTPKRLILLDWGEPKSGKTDLALSFPEPIYFGNLNFGVDELLLGPRWKGRDVEIEDFGQANPGDEDEAAQVLVRFHRWYLDALERADAKGGTVVLDTTSELWELVRVVKLGEAKRERFDKQSKVSDIDKLKNSRLDYGPVNLYMNGLMKRPFHFPNVSAMFLATSKSKYSENGQELAEKVYSGFGALTGIAQMTVRSYKDGEGFHALITHCRHDTSQEGLIVDDPTYDLLRAYALGE